MADDEHLVYRARAMHSLQKYGSTLPMYDGNAYTIGATYHPGTGTVQMYASHPAEVAGQPTGAVLPRGLSPRVACFSIHPCCFASSTYTNFLPPDTFIRPSTSRSDACIAEAQAASPYTKISPNVGSYDIEVEILPILFEAAQ